MRKRTAHRTFRRYKQKCCSAAGPKVVQHVRCDSRHRTAQALSRDVDFERPLERKGELNGMVRVRAELRCRLLTFQQPEAGPFPDGDPPSSQDWNDVHPLMRKPRSRASPSKLHGSRCVQLCARSVPYQANSTNRSKEWTNDRPMQMQPIRLHSRMQVRRIAQSV